MLQKARKLEASCHIHLVQEKLGKDCSAFICSNQNQTSCYPQHILFFSVHVLSIQISVWMDSVQQLGSDCIFLAKSSIFGAINIICKQKSSILAYFYTWPLLLLHTRRKISRIFCKSCLGKLSQ